VEVAVEHQACIAPLAGEQVLQRVERRPVAVQAAHDVQRIRHQIGSGVGQCSRAVTVMQRAAAAGVGEAVVGRAVDEIGVHRIRPAISGGSR
jgi:predicted transcriptional regulator